MKILISDSAENGPYISYIYNSIHALFRNAETELHWGERSELSVTVREGMFPLLNRVMAETIAVGYKYAYFRERLFTPLLSEAERDKLILFLIAADMSDDLRYIRRELVGSEVFALDGFVHFRLQALRQKWERVRLCVTENFDSGDLQEFVRCHLAESSGRITVLSDGVYNSDYRKPRLSSILGVYDTEKEIILSGCGRIICMGELSKSLLSFLKKYYPDKVDFA